MPFGGLRGAIGRRVAGIFADLEREDAPQLNSALEDSDENVLYRAIWTDP